MAAQPERPSTWRHRRYPKNLKRILEAIAIESCRFCNGSYYWSCCHEGVSSERCRKPLGTREETVLGHAFIGRTLPRDTMGSTLGTTQPETEDHCASGSRPLCLATLDFLILGEDYECFSVFLLGERMVWIWAILLTESSDAWWRVWVPAPVLHSIVGEGNFLITNHCLIPYLLAFFFSP